MKVFFSLLVIFSLLVLFGAAPAINESKPAATLLEIKGAIGPATQDFLHRGFAQAAEQNSRIIILQIDTPGGLDKSMRGIIRDIIASPVPVISYVAPGGARAASAGTYILYASHVAAMAPGTNLGAATPVSIGIGGGNGDKNDKKGEKGKQKPEKSAMEKKVIQDASAYIRGLAQLRGRNVEWAEKAVLEGVSLSAEEALAKNVIDIVAPDISSLLKQINGRTVLVQNQNKILDTTNLVIEKIEPNWRTKFLSVITDPSVAYILLLVGVYGLFFEFANPGFVVPGVAGVIALLIALYAFQMLPINYAGMALMFMGIAFMVMEAYIPSFGALGIGGVIAFIIGSILLIDTSVPGYNIGLPLIFTISAVTAAFFLLIVNMALRSRLRPVVSGQEEMVGKIGEITVDAYGDLSVAVHGESWNIKSDVPLKKGQKVKVVEMDGLTLKVEPVSSQTSK